MVTTIKVTTIKIKELLSFVRVSLPHQGSSYVQIMIFHTRFGCVGETLYRNLHPPVDHSKFSSTLSTTKYKLGTPSSSTIHCALLKINWKPLPFSLRERGVVSMAHDLNVHVTLAWHHGMQLAMD